MCKYPFLLEIPKSHLITVCFAKLIVLIFLIQISALNPVSILRIMCMPLAMLRVAPVRGVKVFKEQKVIPRGHNSPTQVVLLQKTSWLDF